MIEHSPITSTAAPTLTDWDVQRGEHDRLDAELRPANKAVVFDALTAAGLTIVTVCFDGYGDSGQIEVRYYNELIAPDDVTRKMALSRPGDLVGLNPIEYLRNTIGLARAADLYGASFFQNSAMPSGVIELEDDLDPEETLAMARSWSQQHQGIGQAGLPAVLTGGAKFNALSITPDDAQFLQSRQFSQNEIAEPLLPPARSDGNGGRVGGGVEPVGDPIGKRPRAVLECRVEPRERVALLAQLARRAARLLVLEQLGTPLNMRVQGGGFVFHQLVRVR
jgi:hypothetical protein